MKPENKHSIHLNRWLSPDAVVHRIDELDFTREFTLPLPREAGVFDMYYSRVVTYDYPSLHQLSVGFGTGRGGVVDPPFAFAYNSTPRVTFTNIYEKGGGIGSLSEALQGVGLEEMERGRIQKLWERTGRQPFYYHDLVGEVLGSAVYLDSLLDVQQSRRAHLLGAKFRMPLLVYAVDALPVDGAMRSIDELIAKGWPFNREKQVVPTISLWARRGSDTFRDVVQYLHTAMKLGHGSIAADAVLDSILSQTAFDDDPKLADIRKEYVQMRESGEDVQKTRHLVEAKFFFRMAEKYAEQMALFRREWIYHDILTSHNAMPVVEFSDASHVSIGKKAFDSKSYFILLHERNVRRMAGILYEFVKTIYMARSEWDLAGRLAGATEAEFFERYAGLVPEARKIGGW